MNKQWLMGMVAALVPAADGAQFAAEVTVAVVNAVRLQTEAPGGEGA